MKSAPVFVIAALLGVFCSFCQNSQALNLKFIKLECETSNKTFAAFQQCSLKALARHNVSLSMYLKLHELPIDDLQLNAQLFHKAGGNGGYRPYMYNSSLNFCRFMKNPNRWMFWKIIWSAVLPATNLNHTCPLNHDVVISNLSLRMDHITLIPFPPNDYMLRLKFIAYKVYWVEVRVYISLYGVK